jgi:hypothetical protein
MKKFQSEEKMKNFCIKNNNFLRILLLVFFITAPSSAFAQSGYKWLTAGAFQNFYGAYGCEIEEGRAKFQQDGWIWPAIYPYQDAQCAKGLWIGTKNFSSEYPFRVVQVGPRLNGSGEFFPTKFQLVGKFDDPVVTVDGVKSYLQRVTLDTIDPNMKADRMIINEANTLIGLTMQRKIMQFSNPQHDNYVVMEYTYTNTGKTDAAGTVTLPNKTLEGVYFYYQYRWAPTRQVSQIVANGARWGMNTMIDARGDSVYSKDLAGENNYRTIFAWHGYYPDKTVSYDNIGAPVFYGAAGAETNYVPANDTVGRIGAPQFVGVLTLHADKSATDKSDDTRQPVTTQYISSDDPATSGDAANNNAFNLGLMQNKYKNFMASGHQIRQAYMIEPTGDFANQKNKPAQGTTGGFSGAVGYGPYDIAPGESVKIVLVEGSAGLSHDKCVEIGRQYKQEYLAAGTNSAALNAAAYKKNTAVLTGKDSLLKTWKMATENFNANYNIENPPLPPKKFDVVSKGDKISLTWTPFPGADASVKYRVYRAGYQKDSTYYMIYESKPGETTYDDMNAIRGISYYYYVSAVGSNGLESNRYYTQTYAPATLKRPAGTNMSQIRVVPNPYIISADGNKLRFGLVDRPNQIAFFGIPGNCTIKIYDELGRLIATPDSPEPSLKTGFNHNDQSGDAYWNCITSYGQIVVSGIYIAVITNNETGEKAIVKFVVIR